MKSVLLKPEKIKPEITGCISRAILLLQSSAFPGEKEIHDIRVLLKKARALLRIIIPQLEKDTADKYKRSLRDAGRIMSPWREGPVLRKTLEVLLKEYPSFTGLFDDFNRELMPETPADISQKQKEELQQVILLLDDTSHDLLLKPLNNLNPDLMEAELEKSYSAISYNYLLSLANPEISVLHELRKRSKDLMYQLNFFRQAYGHSAIKLEKKLDKISGDLGKYHDLFLLKKKLCNNGKKTFIEFCRVISEKQDKYLLRILKASSVVFGKGLLNKAGT